MWGIEVFYNLITKSHSLNGPKSLQCDFQKCFLAFFFSPWGKTGDLEKAVLANCPSTCQIRIWWSFFLGTVIFCYGEHFGYISKWLLFFSYYGKHKRIFLGSSLWQHSGGKNYKVWGPAQIEPSWVSLSWAISYSASTNSSECSL